MSDEQRSAKSVSNRIILDIVRGFLFADTRVRGYSHDLFLSPIDAETRKLFRKKKKKRNFLMRFSVCRSES